MYMYMYMYAYTYTYMYMLYALPVYCASRILTAADRVSLHCRVDLCLQRQSKQGLQLRADARPEVRGCMIAAAEKL